MRKDQYLKDLQKRLEGMPLPVVSPPSPGREAMAKVTEAARRGYTSASITHAFHLAQARGDIDSWEYVLVDERPPGDLRRDNWRVSYHVAEDHEDTLYLDLDQARAFLGGLMCGKKHPGPAEAGFTLREEDGLR